MNKSVNSRKIMLLLCSCRCLFDVKLLFILWRLDALGTIIDWAFEGLDLNKAMCQPATPYKVRHLKMGARVASALCACDPYIAFRMLVCTLPIFTYLLYDEWELWDVVGWNFIVWSVGLEYWEFVVLRYRVKFHNDIMISSSYPVLVFMVLWLSRTPG